MSTMNKTMFDKILDRLANPVLEQRSTRTGENGTKYVDILLGFSGDIRATKEGLWADDIRPRFTFERPPRILVTSIQYKASDRTDHWQERAKKKMRIYKGWLNARRQIQMRDAVHKQPDRLYLVLPRAFRDNELESLHNG